jgi:HEAT repeat protein
MPPAGPFRAVLLTLALAALSSAQARPEDPQPPAPKYPTEVGGKKLYDWVQTLRDQDPSVREEAVRAIILFGPVTGDALNGLIERAGSDPDAAPRTAAVIALGICELDKADHTRVVDALAKRLNNVPDTPGYEPQGVIRLHAALGLCRFGEDSRAAIPALVKATEDRSSFAIRAAAVRALSGAGYVKGGPADLRAYQAAARALKDQSANVRMEAIIALGYMGKCSDANLQATAENLLLNIARDARESNMAMAIWATVSLMMIDRPNDDLIAAIGRHTRSPDFHTRLTAVKAVGVMGPKAKQFVPELIKALNDKEPIVAFQAVLSLGAMGKDGAAAVPALKEIAERKDESDDPIIQDRNLRMKLAAKAAIEQITKPAKP